MAKADDQQKKPATGTPKQRSKGFIESTSFKPTWLETGPLTPDVLPPESESQTPGEAVTESELPDDLAARVAELERLYRESATDDDALDAAEQTDELTGELAVLDEAVTTAEVAQTDGSKDAESSPATVDDSPIPPAENGESSALPAAPPETAAPIALVAPAVVADQDRSASTPSAKPTKDARSRPVRQHQLMDGPAQILLVLGLILLGLAAVTFFVNPFSRLALATAELARPVSSPELANPANLALDWCVTGTFLEAGASPLSMQDDGQLGDMIAGDQVYALEIDSLPSGSYQWQVVGCEQSDYAYPESPAWIQVDNVGEPVTFVFDSQERNNPLFFPIPFTVSALDDARDFRVVGSFQDWDPNDATAVMQHLGGGMYQQIRRIARPGTYEGYVIAADQQQAVDAYGRASNPIPFAFETSQRSDVVVFLLDTNRGRASVLYDMPWVASQLAYGAGYRVLTILLGLLGLFLLGLMLLRMFMMGKSSNWLEAGCPTCGRHELVRIARTPGDRLLHALRVPAYQYQCRNCAWIGRRLSEEGALVSPGATTISGDRWR